MATGCSTNAVVHLIAMARRAGVDLSLDDLDALGRTTPLIANVRPSGASGYLMEDFYYAGGLRALMKQMEALLDTSAVTVSGQSLGETLEGATVYNEDVIRPLSNPVYKEGSLAILRGNLCPDGAVIKPAACDPRFHVHQGPALVFDSYPEMKAAVEDEDLAITPDHVMVLRNAGPHGGPGFPEWGMLPIPKALIKQGHRDMLRISDARMSGTSYGACILHVAPEAYIGGPLALLKTGDFVRLDLPNRRLDMLVDEAELARRRAAWVAPEPRFQRGYGHLFTQHVTQADKGCDFDFLETAFGPAAGEPDIF
jgi:dihydroxy-acid dehydratase